jgi:hypothetical protein
MWLYKKDFLRLIKYPPHEDIEWTVHVAPCILNLGTIWRWMASFMFQPHYPQRTIWLETGWASQSRSEHGDENKNPCPCRNGTPVVHLLSSQKTRLLINPDILLKRFLKKYGTIRSILMKIKNKEFFIFECIQRSMFSLDESVSKSFRTESITKQPQPKQQEQSLVEKQHKELWQ